MVGCDKVFTSEITRDPTPLKNNLYELLNVVPAVPITTTKTEEEVYCDFQPHSGKQYQPKKRSKLKVKTVRDIRRVFEEDELLYLPDELHAQQEFLLKKIKAGSSRDTQTKTLAKKLMTIDKPLSRSALQMLMTINPHDYCYNVQYALYNGKQIRVNGSTGGNKSNLFHFDLSKKLIQQKKRRQLKQRKVIEKRGLLRNSLAVKFKPGPLIKKINLDDSYQKYNVGTTELVKIPKPGLSLQPSLGVILEPPISKIVNNFRDEDGTISEKWAKFSVSVLSQPINSNIIQNDTRSCVTFELNYKFDQKKILMRRDVDKKRGEVDTVNDKILMLCDIDSTCGNVENVNNPEEAIPKHYDSSETEIKTIISQMMDSIEISLLQDEIYTEEVKPEINCVEDSIKPNNNVTHTKEKKKKRYCELDKLDVTVIRLPDDEFQENIELCQNSFCALGCICASLLNPCSIKQHCGRVECMFQCKCDFSKYAKDTLVDTGLLPGIINLDNEINLKLSKEEQKFHRTVVVSGDKSIVLKSEKRNCKASKRYADFYTGMSLKTDEKLQQDVSIVLAKLDCKNVEPWCMVHKLYKCFCKGKFTEYSAPLKNSEVPTKAEHYPEVRVSESNSEVSLNRKLSTCSSIHSQSIYIDDSSDATELDLETYEWSRRCARAMTYRRKFENSYYSQMNTKIKEMEQNDENLRKRMLQLMSAQSPNKKDRLSKSKKLKVQESANKVPPISDDISDPVQKLRPTRERASREMIRSNNALERLQLDEQLEEQPINSNIGDKMPDVFDRYLTQRENSVIEIEKRPVKPTDHENYTKKLSTKHDKAKLISWLENSYQLYKKREQQGKVILEPPKLKKLVIYPWSFILSRYREKKNVFLVTKNKPYRLFMAVNTNNSFFHNCIHVDDISMTDLEKYPVTVQKLLKSSPKSDDNFCILCGLHCCWEFVGSVSKLKDRSPSCSTFSNSTQETENLCESSNGLDIHMDDMDVDVNESYDSKKYCKWFVLTVEEDFREIQFPTRGFFVKHESIVKAAEVARLSQKTVRLSSQKNSDPNVGPQFGIYAVPHTEEYCVFIGPYPKEEKLGIEMFKSNNYLSKLSKGFWLTTEVTENFKVIDDPLSFLRLMSEPIQYFTLDNEPVTESIQYFSINKEPLQSTSIPSTSNELTTKETNITNNPVDDKTLSVTSVTASSMNEKQVSCKKTVKPIRIRNTNGSYRLIPKQYIRKPSSSTTPKLIQSSNGTLVPLGNTFVDHPRIKLPTSSTSLLKSSNVILIPSAEIINKPIAEIAPQIKIVDVYSESTTQDSNTIPNQNPGNRGMFILKPEEINKRVLKDVSTKVLTNDRKVITAPSSERILDEDIENFLATSNIYIPPNADILMNSVEEQIVPKPEVKDVFIECITVDNLGCIKGKRNAENNLSFQFPGFSYTQFYPEQEAISKINQVLSRKVYVPSNIILEWQVVETEDQIKNKGLLGTGQLGLDFVLTKRGLRHKRDIITYAQTFRTFSKQLTSTSTATSSAIVAPPPTKPDGAVEKASEILNEQEDKSEEMDERNDELLQEFAATSNCEIFSSMSGGITNDQREKIAERLQDLLTSSTNDVNPD